MTLCFPKVLVHREFGGHLFPCGQITDLMPTFVTMENQGFVFLISFEAGVTAQVPVLPTFPTRSPRVSLV